MGIWRDGVWVRREGEDAVCGREGLLFRANGGRDAMRERDSMGWIDESNVFQILILSINQSINQALR
jgi:hypothetical protein